MKIFNFNNSVNFKRNENLKPEDRIDNIEEFEKKYDIDRRTVEHCKEYLADWEETSKESFDREIGDIDTIEFEKRPSVITDQYTSGQCLISNLALLRQKQAVMNYSNLFDSSGYSHDGWTSKVE